MAGERQRLLPRNERINHLTPEYGAVSSSAASLSSSGSSTPSNKSNPDLVRTHDVEIALFPDTQQTPLLADGAVDYTKREFWRQYYNVKTGDEVIVDFDGENDPYHPLNWSFRKKCTTTLLYGLTTFGASWASAIYSTAGDKIAEEFGITKQVTTLGTTLLLFGFGLGPLLFGPISEVYGRKIAVFPVYFIAACFSFGTAVAKDVPTIMLTRFFTGIFSSAPLTCAGGVLSDIWDPVARSTALQFYALSVLSGPMIAPVAGGAIISSGLSWRWTEYITGIMMMVILIIAVTALDESYAPALLVAKAKRMRAESNNWALHARHEEWVVSFKQMANKFLITPLLLLTTPIMLTVAIYAAFVYGLLYLTLGAFPIVFQEVRGWDKVLGGVPFLALLVGTATGAGINILNNREYRRQFVANGHKAVPEARLYPMMLGSVLFSGGLFLFAWTSPPQFHWIFSIIAAWLIGTSFITIFQAALNYLIDTFQTHAASAVAAQTFLRSAFAGFFPLLARPLFHDLGTEWGASLLGFVAVAMIPIPIVFYIYGPAIRAKGHYTRQFSEI